MDRVVIIGSGAAGLSAAIRLAEENVPSFIVEEMPPVARPVKHGGRRYQCSA